MGFALPAAIGARRGAWIMGGGGRRRLSDDAAELATVVQERLL